VFTVFTLGFTWNKSGTYKDEQNVRNISESSGYQLNRNLKRSTIVHLYHNDNTTLSVPSLPRTDMLVLHPSSSCDICMEDYELDNLAKCPHAIDCGHILCLTFVFISINKDISHKTEPRCILALEAGVCPLCRNKFQRQTVRELFIDNAPDSTPHMADTHASFLLEQLALVSEADSSPDEVLAVMSEVKDWLSKQPRADSTSTVSCHIMIMIGDIVAHACAPAPPLLPFMIKVLWMLKLSLNVSFRSCRYAQLS